MSLASRILTCLTCCCLLLPTAGCATLHLPFGKDRLQKASARNPVVQIVCIWQPSEGRDPNGMPCRGFAGQILFLAHRGSLPVQVDGDVRIYLFDDKGTPEEQTKPLHQYDFDSASWAPHLTKGTLGPTYSVFVPYTRRGTYEANCALRVRLKTGDQAAIFSDLASIPLDGRTKSTKDTDEQETSTDEAKAATDAVSQAMRRTTTISRDGETAKPNANCGHGQTESLAIHANVATQRVQLANHVTEADSSDPGARRIEELERLVQQLLEQQSRQNNGTSRRAELSPTSVTAPADLPVQKRHPLSEFEDGSSPRPIRTTARPRRHVDSNHPLAALDDELLSQEELPARPVGKPLSQPIVKTRETASPSTRPLRDAESVPARGHSRSDAFDPIDAGAVETTSVEADTVRRQRLRAAR